MVTRKYVDQTPKTVILDACDWEEIANQLAVARELLYMTLDLETNPSDVSMIRESANNLLRLETAIAIQSGLVKG